MLDVGALEQLTEPEARFFGIAEEVEYHGDALRQKSADKRPNRVLQSGRTPDEP